MEPYGNRLRWLVANRYDHFLAGTTAALPQLPRRQQGQIKARSNSLRRSLRIRLALFVAFYAGLIASALTTIASFAPALDELTTSIRWAASIAGAASTTIGVALIITTRHIGLLEADIHAAWLTGMAERIHAN